jgi:hypothetical protein
MRVALKTIKEGYGFSELHLRQSKTNLTRNFGSPDKVTRGEGQKVYWIYRKRGFDCLLSTKTGLTLSLFFFGEGIDDHCASNVVTRKGISVGDNLQEVISVYGKPYKQGGGFSTTEGEYIGHWTSHRSGVGFHFDENDNVAIISIFRKRQS